MVIAVVASLTSAVACVVMLAVTLSIAGHGPTKAAASEPTPTAAAAERPVAAQVASPRVVAAPALAASSSGTGTGTAQAAGAVGRFRDPRVDGSVTPAIAVLSEKLNMLPAALAPLAGADGEVPAELVARLERAANAGRQLGARLELDEVNTQVCVNLFLDQSLTVIIAERADSASSERLAAITRNTLDGIRAVAGDEAVELARGELTSLR